METHPRRKFNLRATKRVDKSQTQPYTTNKHRTNMNTLLIATALIMGQPNTNKKSQPQRNVPQRVELYAEQPMRMRMNRFDGSFSWHVAA